MESVDVVGIVSNWEFAICLDAFYPIEIPRQYTYVYQLNKQMRCYYRYVRLLACSNALYNSSISILRDEYRWISAYIWTRGHLCICIYTLVSNVGDSRLRNLERDVVKEKIHRGLITPFFYNNFRSISCIRQNYSTDRAFKVYNNIMHGSFEHIYYVCIVPIIPHVEFIYQVHALTFTSFTLYVYITPWAYTITKEWLQMHYVVFSIY